MGRGPGDVDSPGGELEEEQHVERLQGDGLDLEEVAGQDACRLGAEELVPRRSVPAGSWVQVVAKEDPERTVVADTATPSLRSSPRIRW